MVQLELVDYHAAIQVDWRSRCRSRAVVSCGKGCCCSGTVVTLDGDVEAVDSRLEVGM